MSNTSRAGLDAYRAILSRPHAAALVMASTLGRIPMGMTSLTNVLLVEQATHSFAVAGLVNGAYALAAAASGPLLGRQVDRIGQVRLLLPSAIVNAAGLLTLLVAAITHLPAPVLMAAAAVAGASRPPLSACMRALWPMLVSTQAEIGTAYALESVQVEVFSIAGPLLAAALTAAVSPAAALGLAVALSLLGVSWMAWSPVTRGQRGGSVPPTRLGALSSPGIRTLLVTNVCIGVAFGTLSVTMPAFASLYGQPAAGGLALATLAFGSMLSGLWYGTRVWRGPLARRLLVLVALFAVGLAPLPLAPSEPTMVLLAGVAGLALAPVSACVYMVIDHLAPRGTRTEAFTWAVSSTATGSSLGSALAGAAVGALGVRQAILTAFVLASAGWLFTAMRRRTLDVA